jgi:tetratricopeptide (TPR) repeat protein
VVNSALDAQIFYEILLAELYGRSGEIGTSYSIMLDAARRSGDAGLFERAVGLALASRSGDAALQAVRTWKREQPQALEPDRYLLQILVALNRMEEAGTTLTTWLQRLPVSEQSAAIASVPRLFERVSDKKLALGTVRSALDKALQQPQTRTAALTTLGRMQRDSGLTTEAVSTALQAHRQDPQALGPLILSMSLLQYARTELKPVLDEAMRGDAPPVEVRMSYARMLISLGAHQEAQAQLHLIGQKFSAYAPAWLVSGLLHMDNQQNEQAQAALERYLALTADKQDPQTQEGRSDALVALAQIAQRNGQLTQADGWLQQIPADADPIKVASQRAALLMKQARVMQAQQLLEQVVPQTEQQSIDKALVLSRWWRERQRPQQAYNVMHAALQEHPEQSQLMSEMAIVCDELQRHEEMEQLLRQLMRQQPEDPQAYNMLGYSLADRGQRLPEALALIEKAVQLAPKDPFIQDSLGWVKFRMGHVQKAQAILHDAYTLRPDAEIAAHLGEVLWVMGDKDRAARIWREGLLLNPENATLRQTMNRLGYTP